MKIIIYGVNYAPELTGIGKYSGEMADWLVEQGHDVHVVTAPPYYPVWKVAQGYSSKMYKWENISGVSVWRCPLYVPDSPSGLKRILHLASFAISSLPVMVWQLFWKPDVVWVVEPPLFCAPAAWFTARMSGAKCWLHIQDFEVDAAFELGIIPFAWMRRFVAAIEQWSMSRFDVVSSISQSMLQRLQDKGVASPVFFPNWSDLTLVKYNEDGRDQFRAENGVLAEQCLCLYSGNIAVKQGLDVLLDVAKKLTDVQFVICGDGANKQNLKLKAEGIENITFLPLQPLEQLSAMLSAADIHLVIQKAGAADLVMPSKLTNILAVGGATIVTAEHGTELARLSEGEDACVLCCQPESSDALVDAIEGLIDNKVLRQHLSKNAIDYSKKYLSMQSVLSQFENKLKGIC